MARSAIAGSRSTFQGDGCSCGEEVCHPERAQIPSERSESRDLHLVVIPSERSESRDRHLVVIPSERSESRDRHLVVIPSERSESRDLHLPSVLELRNADLEPRSRGISGSAPLRVEPAAPVHRSSPSRTSRSLMVRGKDLPTCAERIRPFQI